MVRAARESSYLQKHRNETPTKSKYRDRRDPYEIIGLTHSGWRYFLLPAFAMEAIGDGKKR
jgi:hypothetical protein